MPSHWNLPPGCLSRDCDGPEDLDLIAENASARADLLRDVAKDDEIMQRTEHAEHDTSTRGPGDTPKR